MRLDKDDPRLMDYVLGELEDGEALSLAAALEADENKDAREIVEELRGVVATTRRILHEDDAAKALSDEQRAAIVGTVEEVPANVVRMKRRKSIFPGLLTAAAVIAILAAIAIPNTQKWISKDYYLASEAAPHAEPPPPPIGWDNFGEFSDSFGTRRASLGKRDLETIKSEDSTASSSGFPGVAGQPDPAPSESTITVGKEVPFVSGTSRPAEPAPGSKPIRSGLEVHDIIRTYSDAEAESIPPQERSVVSTDVGGDSFGAPGNGGFDPSSGIEVQRSKDELFDYSISGPGDGRSLGGHDSIPEDPAIVEARNRLEIDANLKNGLSLKYESDVPELKPEPKPEPKPQPKAEGASKIQEEQWTEYNVGNLTGQTELPGPVASNFPEEVPPARDEVMTYDSLWQWNTPDNKPTEIVGGPGTETYVKVAGVKPFLAVRDEPLSTFSIDVDTAAYSNVRRFLNQGQLPPPDAVRIEEMINYFAYAYPQPVDGRPFAVNVMGAPAPWEPQHRLVRIGVKGKEVPQSERPSANLVFLLDVSGSMGDANKLPLVKESMKTLLGQLRANDRVAIVTYAGNASKVLDPTPCSEPARIVQAIDSLRSGGSTNGGGGIQMAYDLAQASFIQEGINRVIIATDGDFNVGTTAHGDLMSMIEARAKSGVFLTALGFGMGNLKDSTLEQLANRGNGNYAYIDNHAEARRALVDQLSGTLQTIAKDVKIQVEFNPALVSHYRLLGYENRALANRDFNDDTKDAGEIGAGHTVTALYEIIPVGSGPAPGVDPLRYEPTAPGVDALKYQESSAAAEGSIAPEPQPAPTGEWLTVKMRYKEPQGNESTRLDVPLTAMNSDLRETDADFRFASAVAAFGQVLRHSGYRHASNFDRIIDMARAASNGDADREAFVDMVITAKTLSGSR